MSVSTSAFDTTGFINVGEALTDRWPSFLPELPEGSLLDHLWAAGLEATADEEIVLASARLLVEQEIVLRVPGVDAVGIAIASANGDTLLPVEVTILPDFAITLRKVPIALRLKGDLFRPATREAGGSASAPPRWVVDTTRDFVDIRLAEVTISVNRDGDITVDFDGAIDLPPSMIGNSGVVIEAHDISLHLSADDPPPGQPAGWRGVHIGTASLYLPGELSSSVGTLALTDAYIGNGGFTGAVSSTWTPSLSAELFGMSVTLARAEIAFVQNTPEVLELGGTVTLPFFDQPVGVDLQIGIDGSIGMKVSSVQPPGATTTNGLLQFTKPDLLTMQLDSLAFLFDDGVFTASLSGTLTPLVGGLDWPSFHVKELAIDSEGNVRLEGGWLNLPSQYSLDFYGFQVAITRLGMGSSDDGGRWIGFSGSIKFVDGLSIGGSVDGLRITWYDDGRATQMTLDGVGVELVIPEALQFKGSVSYHELPGPQHRFDGDITLELLALDLHVDGKIVIGTDTNIATGETYTFFALYIGVELPAGIPLWATGLGLYGIAGLVAIQMAPNKGAEPNVLHPASRPEEEWFENADASPGWYKRPVVGVTDLRSKWDPVEDGFALGGGVTIGTLADNGFTFNGSLLLVVSFPGPVILLEGKANLLKERAALSDEPLFRALAVLDVQAGTLLVGLMAQYKFASGGELIEIGGSAEAFFDFADYYRFHLYLGEKEPKEKRIRAQIFSLFEANAYFMLEPAGAQLGAWVGYDEDWKFGPLRVVVEAWIEGGVVASKKPVHFHGELWLHGKIDLRVFGFGLGLTLDALFAADGPFPYHLLAQFSAGISLPWPLPDFDVDITLEWGPSADEPPLPTPLKEIAIEHFKATASWPLPRASLLLPNVDTGDGFLVIPPPPAPLAAGPPADAPVVPLDARPHVTFGSSVHDDALVGVNPQPVWPVAVPVGWEWIGDPATNQGPMRTRNAIKEIALARWDGTTWIDVARKATTANAPGVKELYGSWAPVPQLPSGLVTPGTDPPLAQVKLWLWSKTPFDYSRHGGQAWDEWFTDTYDEYPCIPPVPERTICCSFDRIPVGTVVTLPQPCRDHREIVFVGNAAATVEALDAPSHDHSHALCWQTQPGIQQLITSGPTVGLFGVLIVGGPASRMKLVFAAGEAGQRACVDYGQLDSGTVPLPLQLEGIGLRVFEFNGAERAETPVRSAAGRRGADLAFRGELTLPCPAERVILTLVQQSSPVRVLGRDTAGTVVATASGPNQQGAVNVELIASGITSVQVEAPQAETLLAEVCYECAAGALSVDAIAVDADGTQSGPFLPVGDTITVEVARLRGVLVRGIGTVCLVEVCVTFPPDPAEVAAREEMAKRLVDSMALWGNVGEVLEAHRDYRLKVVTTVEAIGEGPLSGVTHDHDITELAYFRTQGPPALAALSTPMHHPPGEPFDSGLDDLTRYVAQTVPPTVPAPGQQPILPRPVYRAYDVGVVFNEDYVDLMYRLAHCDLLLYLYDSNNRPVRDVAGRLIVSANRWGVTESVTLTESEVRYLTVIDQATCVSADPTIIPHQVTLFAVDPGLVLAPDLIYEARLIPLLLHEDFSDGLAGWTVVDSGTNQGPSAWSVLGHPKLDGIGASASGPVVTLAGAGDLSALDPGVDVVLLATDTARLSKVYRVVSVNNATKQVTVDGTPTLFGGTSAWSVPGWGAVRQTSNIWGGVDDPSPPKPGTMLIGGDPAWTDYRLAAQLRSSDDDAIGVVFRYRDSENHYRFSMDREYAYRRLVRVASGATTVLGEDDFVYSLDQDYVVSVEVIGDSLRIYQDGALVFAVSDPTFLDGRIGMYCWANVGARFSDVRVDDFRPAAPTAYRFAFTTSEYSSFFHNLHSFQDETWETAAVDGDLAAEIAAASQLGTAPSDAEQRAFASFAAKVLGPTAQQRPATVEVHRVIVDDDAVALLVRSPEPFDWARTELEVSLAGGSSATPGVPGVLKLTDVSAGGSEPNDESVTLLARDRANLSGTSIEVFGSPGPLADVTPDLLLDDHFDGIGGILFEEVFSANALDAYRVVDAPGALLGPSQWTVSGGAIMQNSNIYSGSVAADAVDKLGTVALVGPRLANCRLTVVVRSGDDDAIGVVFRYDDDQNWYRYSMDRERTYRRLVKSVAGAVTVLWEDAVTYDLNGAYEIRIDAFGDLLLGYIDGALLFVVRDGDVHDGQVGLYCWANVSAGFEALRVESLESNPLLWQAALNDPAELTIRDSGTHDGPSTWLVGDGEARQSSKIWGDSPDPSVAFPSTVALLRPSFDDLRLSVRLRSTNENAIGVVLRYVDADNWYRFSMDRQRQYRRLVRCTAGALAVLWQDAIPYELDQSYELTITAEGSRLIGRLDGSTLFDLFDDGPVSGRIGLYCWANDGAHFERVVVTSPVRQVGRWRIVDDVTVAGPSRWRQSSGLLRQTSNAHTPGLPDARGTTAVAGDPTWDDYRVTLRVRSDDDGAIGLAFRRRDRHNFYRLSLDAQGSYRRLVRVVDGITSVLWQDTAGYQIGVPFNITVDAIGDRLVGYRGDEPLFNVHDDRHAAGAVGLYAWQNPGARVERITVNRPPLDAYAIFHDRFAAGDLAAWTILDEGTESAPSAWSIVAGTLHQTSNIHSLPLDAAAIEKPGSLALAGDLAWDDVVLTVRLTSTDDDAIGVVVRYQDAANFYRFSMDRERAYRRLVRCAGGVFTTLWEDDVTYEAGRGYDLAVAAVGARLSAWLDGVPLFEVEDDLVSSGQIGLYCWGNVGAQFANVRVFGADQLRTDFLMEDDFDWEVAGLWSYATAGDRQGPAEWQTITGELKQTSDVQGGSPDAAELAKPGTIALAGDATWGDYRVTARLRSDDDDAIGVVVRYTDADNWYRFSMDRERSYRRLVKCVGGTAIELWSDGEQYVVGRDYLVTVDVVADAIVGYIDGVELFSVRDGDIARGAIGLYCWANTGARFSSVRVAAAGWSTYCRFSADEPPLEAGTRVVVHSGNASGWTSAPTPCVTHRFLAELLDPGRFRLPTTRSAALRVRAANDALGHARRFLPLGAHTMVATARLLRRADGLDFAIILPAATPLGSRLDDGEYRLRLTYRRDNTAQNPDSLVLSQAGDTSNEVVLLDIP